MTMDAPMTLVELQAAIAEAMPGPRKGDMVDFLCEGKKSIKAIVISPGKIFESKKLGVSFLLLVV